MDRLRAAFEAARLDPGRVDEALAAAERVLARAPGHPAAAAYRGALHAMKAGEATLPWIKMRHATTAAALLDEAWRRREEVAGDLEDPPGDLEVLLLRGIAYANFPVFLGRSEDARQSLEAARVHPAFSRVPTFYRALAYAHLAVLCHRDRDARRAEGHLALALQADAALGGQIWAAR